MFKRANKITSLLVTAAAVMSLVPAYAADVKKVDSQDGTVYNAVAYKDGKFYIDGEVNDKDEAAYYVADGKYNNLSDVDAGADVTTYGTKYVDVQGGDYFVDLTTGKVTDDKIEEDGRDDASSNLKKKVKADTDGRYLKDGTSNAADTEQTFVEGDRLPGNKFGEVWYGAQLSAKDATNGGASKLNVYTDGSGNYIDADFNLGKIKVETTGKAVYVENTDDTYDTTEATCKISASVATNSVVLGQDKDYIYRKAEVTVTTTGSGAALKQITKIDGKDVASLPLTFRASGNGYTFTAIQKISKAQSSDEAGGAKYAKTAYTYIFADSDAKAYTAGSDKANFLGQFDGSDNNKFAIANGKIIAYNTRNTAADKNVTIDTATLKSEDGLYYVDLASSSTEDTETTTNTNAVDVDADGNVYRLDGGYIYQWNNDEDWDKLFKVDGSFNKLSVYDKNNMVGWNEDDDVYSVISGKTTTKDPATTTTTTTTAAAGWVKATDGTWSYTTATGTKATGWFQDNSGTWYYAKAEGTMVANGWALYGTTWYYLGASGAMATSAWVQSGADWYYVGSNGAMLSNTVVDGYKLGASGAWVR